jgi:hypothetical protein
MLIGFHETSFESFTNAEHRNTKFSNFLQPIMATWRVRELAA